VEGALLWHPRVGPDMVADLGLSFWGNRNRVLRLDGPPYYLSPFTYQFIQKGLPVGSYMARPFRYADRNGDGILDTSEVALMPDFGFAAVPFPTQGALLTGAVSFRGWLRVSAGLEYRAGNALLNSTESLRCASTRATCRAVNDPTAPLADQASAVVRDDPFTYGSVDGYIEDADFARLRELTVTLTAPGGWAHRIGASDLKLTLAGHNLLKWTHYRGPDPEVNSAGESGLAVIDAFSQPLLRYWTARLDVEF